MTEKITEEQVDRLLVDVIEPEPLACVAYGLAPTWEEQYFFSVAITSVPSDSKTRINVMKLIRELIAGIPLIEAKRLMDEGAKGNCVIAYDVVKYEAEDIAKRLQNLGCGTLIK